MVGGVLCREAHAVRAALTTPGFAHRSQKDRPGMAWYWPRGQTSHSAPTPPRSVYRPGAQARKRCACLSCDSARACPAAHNSSHSVYMAAGSRRRIANWQQQEEVLTMPRPS